MIPVDQTKFGKPDGDCFAACIASVLEVPLESLPNLNGYSEDDWWLKTQEWVEENSDYSYIEVSITGLKEAAPIFGNSYWIATGKSPRGGCNHAVVFCRDKMVHDPYPDRAGLLGEPTSAGFFTLRRKKKADFIKAVAYVPEVQVAEVFDEVGARLAAHDLRTSLQEGLRRLNDCAWNEVTLQCEEASLRWRSDRPRSFTVRYPHEGKKRHKTFRVLKNDTVNVQGIVATLMEG